MISFYQAAVKAREKCSQQLDNYRKWLEVQIEAWEQRGISLYLYIVDGARHMSDHTRLTLPGWLHNN